MREAPPLSWRRGRARRPLPREEVGGSLHSPSDCRYIGRTARLAELGDAAGLGPAAARRGGSSPSPGTTAMISTGPGASNAPASLGVAASVAPLGEIELDRLRPSHEPDAARRRARRAKDGRPHVRRPMPHPRPRGGQPRRRPRLCARRLPDVHRVRLVHGGRGSRLRRLCRRTVERRRDRRGSGRRRSGRRSGRRWSGRFGRWRHRTCRGDIDAGRRPGEPRLRQPRRRAGARRSRLGRALPHRGNRGPPVARVKRRDVEQQREGAAADADRPEARSRSGGVRRRAHGGPSLAVYRGTTPGRRIGSARPAEEHRPLRIG